MRKEVRGRCPVLVRCPARQERRRKGVKPVGPRNDRQRYIVKLLWSGFQKKNTIEIGGSRRRDPLGRGTRPGSRCKNVSWVWGDGRAEQVQTRGSHDIHMTGVRCDMVTKVEWVGQRG